MVHVCVDQDAFSATKLPIALLSDSLRSVFIFSGREKIDVVPVSEFLRKLYGGLHYLTLIAFKSNWFTHTTSLSHCCNLLRLTLYCDVFVDLSFLRFMPQLKAFAVFVSEGIREEDAVVISREAPRLESISFRLCQMFSAPPARAYFINLGRELRSVKNLMMKCNKQMLDEFLDLFLSNESVFCQVTTLRLLEETVFMLPASTKSPVIAHVSRPQCTISRSLALEEFRGKLCSVCWQRMTSSWMCELCGFATALLY